MHMNVKLGGKKVTGPDVNETPGRFFLKYCVLILSLVVSARFVAFAAAFFGETDISIYHSIDLALASIFPAIKHLAAGSDDSAQLRLFLYLAWGLMPAVWVWVFLHIRRRQASMGLQNSASPMLVISGIAFVWLLIWIFLFRDTTVHLDYVSRGGALLWLLRSSVMGQIAFALVLFFFLAMAVPALLWLIVFSLRFNRRK